MTTKISKLIPLAVALAVISPTVAPAAIPNPQSDAAMRKAIRDYAKFGLKGKTVKATKIKVECVQAAKIGSTRACSGTFSLTLAGKTAQYELNKKSQTFRISPGAMEGRLNATAITKAPGLPTTVKWSAILQ